MIHNSPQAEHETYDESGASFAGCFHSPQRRLNGFICDDILLCHRSYNANRYLFLQSLEDYQNMPSIPKTPYRLTDQAR